MAPESEGFMAVFDLNKTVPVIFEPLTDHDGLPFPLNIDVHSKYIILVLMLATLIYCTKLRVKIFSYLASPEAKTGAINVLVWFDQVNGMILGLLILLRIIFLAAPVAFSTILGENFCKFVNLIGAFCAGK